MPETVDGRRIYIHRDALGDVAQRSKRQAYDTSRALAQVRLAKIAHHYIVDNGTELGAVRAETAGMLLPITVAPRRGSVTTFLRGLSYTPKLPWRNYPRLPVLFPHEEITDTCFQDGYYTFATGDGAAARMFEDRVPMPELKESVAAGKGPEDLTIITRRGRLAVAAQVSVDFPGSSSQPISLAEARSVDAAVLNKVNWGMSAAAGEIGEELGGYTDFEAMTIEGLVGAVDRTFRVPSY